jgi:hypothetical protein
MTPSDLKYNVQNRSGESHYFTRASMKFFGDTMANYGVRSAVVTTNYNAEGDYVGGESGQGVEVEVWELYRKRAVKHGLKDSVYFAKDDYRRVYSKKDV